MTQFRTSKRNNNKHTQRGMGLLANSMREDGYVAPVTVAADGESLDGSARLETIEEVFPNAEPIIIHSDGTRPIVHVRDDIQNAEQPIARRIATRANRIAQLNLDYDVDVLLQDAAAGIDLDALGLRYYEVKELMAKAGMEMGGQADAEPQIDKAAELNKKWKVKRGDLWSIGEHRLLCGDSTVREDVERVMGGERASMVFTDPPYNVNYGANANPRWRVRVIENDSKTPEDWAKFCELWMQSIFSVADGGVYICMSDKELPSVTSAFLKAGGHWSSYIVWVKDRFVLGLKDYHSRNEKILYGWVEGKSHVFTGGRDKDDVWEIARPSTSEEHPTMKPVELVARAVANSSDLGDNVYEPFAGSGTTLVACQNLSRKCRAIEISENYCAVILERMATAFPALPIELIP